MSDTEHTAQDTCTPIACTLDRGSYTERVAAIQALFAQALIDARREAGRLHLTFDAAARADVDDLVRKERACCAFLDFEVAEKDGALLVTITAPSEAADDLLALFRSHTSNRM